MNVKTKWKRNLILVVALLSITLSMLSPFLDVFADMAKAERDFDKKTSDFLEDAEDATDIIKILEDDEKANPNPDRNTINYVMRRLFYPGVYVNNVEDGVLSSSIKKKKKDILRDGKYACNPNAPNNLINHNCNIPNFTTGLIQNIIEPFYSPFDNAEMTSSYATFGLGVPNNIPGGTVPVNPNDREHAYTALELYGYNLPLTSYKGEWDQIVVSTSSRMLSNFGVIDTITLTGTTLWNSTKAGVSSFIENFSFNPKRWFGTIAKAWESGVSSGINTVVDTSELNVVATHGWKRPNLDKTLYNVYVMSDKEILAETALRYFTEFTRTLGAKANSNETLNKALSLKPDEALEGIEFIFDPEMETEESIEIREKAEEKRAEEEAHNEAELLLERILWEHHGIEYEPDLIDPLTEIPDPEYYTESEQLGIWEERPEVNEVLNKARGENLLTESSASDYETYDDLISEWQEKYTPYFEGKFSASGLTVNNLLDETDSDLFQEHPHLDPKQGISRYACANDDGTVMRDENGMVEYLYEKNNDGSQQFINPNCNANVRPPIGGGYFGTGWENSKIDDTRHISNVPGDGTFARLLSNGFSREVLRLNAFIAKITNVILDLSFSPLLDKLGVDVIVSKLVEGFRDTVFFPLAGLVAAIGAVMLFFELLRNGSAWQLLMSIVMTFLIFIAGSIFLLYPNATMKVLDDLPTKVDHIVADAILGGESETSYCSTGEDRNGVRSAQCSVWGAMVFEPWVHLQFGTGYDNLYAKGYAPAGSGEMKNTNTALVGNAEVNMGGGKIVNNWAMYQLSKTKAGTINQKDTSGKIGMVDKDMYRLVDLQAGPNNGAGRDDRYYQAWSGASNGGFLVVLTTIQSVLMAFAIGSLGVTKIGVSFMFSISILFFPLILLYAMLPRGRARFKEYLANLLSLLIKRVLVVLMLSVLLKIIVLGYSKADSLQTGAFMAIFISIAMLIYRKELLEMITATESGDTLLGGSTEKLKEAAANIVPQYVKQRYNMVKFRLRGTVAGFAGGALGAASYKTALRARKMSLSSLYWMSDKLSKDESEWQERMKRELDEINDEIKSSKGLSVSRYEDFVEERLNKLEELNAHEETMNKLKELELNKDGIDLDKLGVESEEELQEMIERDMAEVDRAISQLESEIAKLDEEIALGPRASRSIMSQAIRGSRHSRGIIGRQAERRIRSEGFSLLMTQHQITDEVYTEGAEKILNLENELEHDAYKEILSRSEHNKSQTNKFQISEKERGQLQSSPKLQKLVRELAKKRRKQVESDEFKDALRVDKDEVDKIAAYVDYKRGVDKTKHALKNPSDGLKQHISDLKEREKIARESSKAEHIIERIDDYIERNVGGEADEVIIGEDGSPKEIYYERGKASQKAQESKYKARREREEQIARERKKIEQEREELIRKQEERNKEGTDNE